MPPSPVVRVPPVHRSGYSISPSGLIGEEDNLNVVLAKTADGEQTTRVSMASVSVLMALPGRFDGDGEGSR